jgi:hypothetical protein
MSVKDLSDLYARYDGPLPRTAAHTARPVCWEMMMRGHLRAIRLRRHQGLEANELAERLKEIRRFLVP